MDCDYSLPLSTPGRFKRVSFTSLNSLGSLGGNDCGFGFSKLSQMTYSDMVDQYKDVKIEGLYAIVIPSGGGKSTMAREFSQLDVDLVLPEGIENHLKVMRVYIQRRVESEKTTNDEWRRHNLLWVWQLGLALKNYDFSADPRVIFIHSPEIALQIGAEVIGVLLPTPELHRKWMLDRAPEAITLGRQNRILLEKCLSSKNYLTYSSGSELGVKCAQLIAANVGYAPGLCKYLPWGVMSDLIDRAGFDKTIHARIRNEQGSEEDITQIIDACKNGRLPWWHVGIWCERHCEEVVPDGGHKLNAYPWLHLGYTIHDSRRKQSRGFTVTSEMIRENTDWFSLYPYMDGATMNQGNVTLRSLFKGLDVNILDDYVLKLLSVHIGAHHAFVVSVIVYYLGVVVHLRSELRESVVYSGMLEVPEERWVDVHGELHKLVRSYQTFFGLDLDDREYTRLQYTACLYGRRNYALDPGAEIAKRRAPRLLTKFSISGTGHNREEYIRDFKSGVEKAYMRLGTKKRKLAWYDMNEFFEKRYQWAASGSVTNLPENMKHLKEAVELVQETKDTILRVSKDVNKKIIMEKLSSPAELAYYLVSNWGYNDTGLAPKPNEPAKERVLMPGSFIHYVAMSYVLGMVERTGDVGGVRIGDPEDNALSHFDLRLSGGTYNFMLDFADHNAQHSSVEMSIIMSYLESKFSGRTDAKTLTSFVDWIVMSFFNMRIRDGAYTHSVLSGLYTGWRGTTWINSVACQAYVNVGIEAVRRRFGSMDCQYFEGAGDDVMMKFGNALDAFRFYRCMSEIGYDMQSIKQLLSHNKTEFLRVIGSGSGVRCCINRVMPNFISGDLERSSPGMLERVGGAYATTRMLLRRGLHSTMVKALYSAYMNKWLRVKVGDQYQKIDRVYIHGLRSMGGCEIPDENDQTWVLTGPVSVVRERCPVKGGPSCASRDYANVISKELSRYQILLDSDRYSDVLTGDVYGKGDILEPNALINSGVAVRVKVNPLRQSDYEEYERALVSCNDDLVSRFKNEWGRYSRYKSAIPYCNVNSNEFSKRMGLTMDIAEVEKFSLPAFSSFLIPEYVLYNFGMYYKSRIAFGVMNAAEASYRFRLASNAASEIFQQEIEL